MNILINALRLAEGKNNYLGGNFYHVFYFVKALNNVDGIKLFIISDKHIAPEFQSILDPSRIIIIDNIMPSFLSFFWEEFQLKQAVKKYKIDIYHRLTGQLPFIKLGCKEISTIADLNFTKISMNNIRKMYKHISYYWTVKKADSLIAISDFTKQAIIKKYHLSDEAITVIHHGTNRLPAPSYIINQKLGCKYWLTFGHQKHKNIETAIEAIYRYNKDYDENLCLVVIGENDYLNSLKNKLDINKRAYIIFPGRISSNELNGLYEKAKGLLFLSTYEGFGLPILEAMSSRCPIISSSVCSLPEVGGNAAIFVDPFDIESIVKNMHKIEYDDSFRSKYIKSGEVRSHHFTWEKAVEKTITIYRNVYDDYCLE